LIDHYEILLVPIVEGIDGVFFGKASDKEIKSFTSILAKLITGAVHE